ncbi:PAS domain-containing protein [Limnohabitans sp. B9-3]|jgi:PAS domain S-box-containing protein|uniref:PAS domain-containing protein n=1 Tax=Limnohabitans sp. B9-3 TaxID=1100707 RepID=UPI000C1F0133|nr:PAS domain-containing protein [Limnohabitans sp. B9-3]PIT74562.1 aerotaxis receptor Aer [Limnohabitans sp. B9-3]
MSLRDIVPTDKEIVMREDDFIVSKTDLKGRITYGNKTFIEFSGFEEKDILGIQHNVIRHPDMPRAVFKMLWSSIQEGREIFAYVKNICKDGSFYWVIANITPSVDEKGQVLGYYSVRRKPHARAIPVISALYRRMLDEERRVGSRDAIAASTRLMDDFLNEKGMGYEQFVLTLQSA